MDDEVVPVQPKVSLPADLLCPICKDLLRDAVMMPCCAGSACDECARDGIINSEGSKCPVCGDEASPEDVIPYRMYRNKVDEFKNKTGYVAKPPPAHQPDPTPSSFASLPDIVLPDIQAKFSHLLQPRSSSSSTEHQQQPPDIHGGTPKAATPVTTPEQPSSPAAPLEEPPPRGTPSTRGTPRTPTSTRGTPRTPTSTPPQSDHDDSTPTGTPERRPRSRDRSYSRSPERRSNTYNSGGERRTPTPTRSPMASYPAVDTSVPPPPPAYVLPPGHVLGPAALPPPSSTAAPHINYPPPGGQHSSFRPPVLLVSLVIAIIAIGIYISTTACTADVSITSSCMCDDTRCAVGSVCVAGSTCTPACKADEKISGIACMCGGTSCDIGGICTGGSTCTPVCQADVASGTDCLCGDANCAVGSTCVGGSTCTAGFRSNPGWQPWMMERDNASIIAVGNPGVGKSTILNSLAEELLFKSGVNFGGGLTFQLDEKTDKNGRMFYDTPGLADRELRIQAGKAITQALQKGGDFKILFFLRTESGRAINEDITTLKLVLDSAPEIGNQYFVVINKVSSKLSKKIQDKEHPEHMETFLTEIFANIDVKRHCSWSNIIFLPIIDKVDEEDDKLIPANDLKTIDGRPFKNCIIEEKLSNAKLTKGTAKDIDIANFEKKNEEIEKLKKMLKENNAMWEEKLSEIKQAQKEAEEARQEAEKARKEREEARQEARDAKEKKEKARKETEEAKQEARDAKEKKRVIEEKARQETEEARQETEEARQEARDAKEGWSWKRAGEGARIGAGAGAGTGAIVGTAILPGLGTAIGTVAGTVGGAVIGAIEAPIIEYFNL